MGTDAAVAAGNEDPDLVPLVVDGWPATEIVRAAWQTGSEIVVVGPPAARFDGSARATIFRVLRRADLPLLVARRDPWRTYARVLCAVDRSVTAADTIGLALRFAPARTAARITLFHAYHVPFESWVKPDTQEMEDEALAHVRSLARTAMEVAPVRTLVRKGDACVEMLRAAGEERADLVVLGTHGRPGLARAFLGSGAEWVLANAPFDVAVARPHRLSLERR